MSQLSEQQCKACSRDASHASGSEIRERHRTIPEWQIVERNGIMQLVQCFMEQGYRFCDFRQAMEFPNRVGEIAEKAGHHSVLLRKR